MKLLLLAVFISIPLLVTSSHSSNHSTSHHYCPLPTECMHPEDSHGMTLEHVCCGNLTEAFECSWWNGRMQLTQYLKLLNSWNCSEQLKLECKQRTFSFNDFTEKIYLSYCDHPKLEEACLPAITADANITWGQATRSLDTSLLHKDKLQDSCVQIALYESNKTDFTELVRIDFLTCSVIWCGFDSNTYRERDISLWSCAPSSCKISIVIIAILLIIVAIVSLVINSLVIYIYRNTPALQHGQSYYKTSIAISDVIIALFVMPSTVSNLFTRVHRPIELKLDESSNTSHYIAPFAFNRVYTDIFGFFFLAATLVSLYTLLFAAADRLYAVFRPLNYRRRNTKLLAFRVCVGIWVTAAVISILPVFADPFLLYGVIFSVLFTFAGSLSIIIYAVFLGLPIPTMWAICIATYLVTRKHTRKTVHLTSSTSGGGKASTVETRLAKTLLFMVMAFTLSILPSAIILILGFSVPNINLLDPRSLDVGASSRIFSAEFFAYLALIYNTMWNFFIYNARNEQFKKAVRVLRADVLTKLGCTRLVMKWDTPRTKSNASSNMSKRKTTRSGLSNTNDVPSSTNVKESATAREFSSTAV